MSVSKLVDYLTCDDIEYACFIGSYFLFKRYFRRNFKSVEERKKAINKGFGCGKPSLLMCVLLDEEHPRAGYKIAKFLIREGADVNYLKSDGQNALQFFYTYVWRAKPRHYMRVTKLLVKSGIDINNLDNYGITALSFLLTNHQNDFANIRKVCLYLLKAGADYRCKDRRGKSCLDDAQEMSWSRGFLELVKDFENGRYS